MTDPSNLDSKSGVSRRIPACVLWACIGASICYGTICVREYAQRGGIRRKEAEYQEWAKEALDWMPRELNKLQHANVRSNALAAFERLRSGRFRSGMEPLMIMAHLSKRENGDMVLWPLVLATGLSANRLVISYIDEDTGKLVRIEYDRGSDHADVEDYFDGVPTNVILTPRSKLTEKAEPAPDGTLVVHSEYYSPERNFLRIPDGEVSVGFRYPDGKYTNFVPLTSGGPDWGVNGTTKP